MQCKKEVKIIPQKNVDTVVDEKTCEIKKKRVAGYARVSTELEEQQNSYKTQLDYYTEYINSRPD